MHKNIKQNNYSRYAANRDVISLFSGAMGLDIGLGKAGLNVAIGQDFDAACVKTMQPMAIEYWAEILGKYSPSNY